MSKKQHMAIYEPPHKGLPFLAVTFKNDQLAVVPLSSRKDARRMVAEHTRKAEKEERAAAK